MAAQKSWEHISDRLASDPSEPGSSLTRRLDRLVGDIPPCSLKALAIAIICFTAAVALHVLFNLVGGSLPFVTYFPALLVAALVAGLPAGLLVLMLSLLAVRWAFMAPLYQFFPLSYTDLLDLVGFVLASGCILVATELYRTSLRQLREQGRERELIMKELEHRGRNTYAVIDAIIKKTFEDQPERAHIASGRIRAVKYANDLLSETSTHIVLLKTLLLHEFIAYGEGRFHTEGPDVELAPETARHLALVFHELITNAAKHGALSKPGGRVLLSWESIDGLVTLEWREEGGPVVGAPKKHGFGSTIVAQSLKSVSGSIITAFAPEGLHCTITFRA